MHNTHTNYSLKVCLVVGVSNALGGMVNASSLLRLRVGVSLLTAGGGTLGGVSRIGAGDVTFVHRLTLGSGLLSLGRGSLGGVACRLVRTCPPPNRLFNFKNSLYVCYAFLSR